MVKRGKRRMMNMLAGKTTHAVIGDEQKTRAESNYAEFESMKYFAISRGQLTTPALRRTAAFRV